MDISVFSSGIVKKNIDKPQNYKGIYFPSGELCELSITFESNTLRLLSCKWSSKKDSTFTIEKTTLTDLEVKLFEILNIKPTKSEVILNAVFFFVKGGSGISSSNHAESKLPPFYYLYSVGIQDSEDLEDIKWLPMEKWESVRFLKQNERLFNAQDFHSIQIDMNTIGEDLLKTISETNPFNRLVGNQGPGNGVLYVPTNQFDFQRTENWVLIQPKNYEKNNSNSANLSV